jgi:hypothetical protein
VFEDAKGQGYNEYSNSLEAHRLDGLLDKIGGFQDRKGRLKQKLRDAEYQVNQLTWEVFQLDPQGNFCRRRARTLGSRSSGEAIAPATCRGAPANSGPNRTEQQVQQKLEALDKVKCRVEDLQADLRQVRADINVYMNLLLCAESERTRAGKKKTRSSMHFPEGNRVEMVSALLEQATLTELQQVQQLANKLVLQRLKTREFSSAQTGEQLLMGTKANIQTWI